MNEDHPHWDAYQISAKLAANLCKCLPFFRLQRIALMEKDTFVSYLIENYRVKYTGNSNMPPMLSKFKSCFDKAWFDHMEEEMVLPRDLDKLKITIELFSHFSEQAFKTFVLNKEVAES